MSVRRTLPAVALALMVAAPAFAQNIQTRNLNRPEVEYEEPFTALSAIRELKDGRVIAIDPRDKTVQAIDMRAGTTRALGREGSGPGEWGLPTGILALANDTTGIIDMLNNRILLINPNATVGGFVDLNAPAPPGARAGGSGMMMVGGSMPSASDAKGRMYVRGSPLTIVDGQPRSADSVAMMRWDRASGRRDTVAFLRLPPNNAQVSGARGNVSIRIGGGAPFQAADQMAVGPDGRVAIVHADPYSVEFVSETGQRTKGQPIRYDRIRVSNGHKEEWRESRRNAMGMAITNDNGRRSATMMPMREVQDPEDWGGEFMPPFLSNSPGLTVGFSNDGYLWVRRTGPAGMAPTYDVIDRAGNVAAKVVLPQRSRIVGFGNGTVYTVRLDEDDLQYLQRHRFSMPDRP